MEKKKEKKDKKGRKEKWKKKEEQIHRRIGREHTIFKNEMDK